MIARLRLALVLLAAAGIILAQPQPKSLKAGYGNAAPISYVDSSGQPRGFAVDVLNEAARREGVRIQWVLGSAKPANDLLREGAIDLLAAGVITPERQR